MGKCKGNMARFFSDSEGGVGGGCLQALLYICLEDLGETPSHGSSNQTHWNLLGSWGSGKRAIASVIGKRKEMVDYFYKCDHRRIPRNNKRGGHS